MKSEVTAQGDLEILMKLNADYLSSDQNSNVARYEEFLAPEFTASLPDYKIYDRQSFLKMIARPRPFTDLECYDVLITIIGDVALVHAGMSLKTLKGEVKHGRYTDEHLKRDGKWMCIGANVIAEPL